MICVMKTFFNWDGARVKLIVPVNRDGVDREDEVELGLESFARLLLTNVPSDWFAEVPVSFDLPFFIED